MVALFSSAALACRGRYTSPLAPPPPERPPPPPEKPPPPPPPPHPPPRPPPVTTVTCFRGSTLSYSRRYPHARLVQICVTCASPWLQYVGGATRSSSITIHDPSRGHLCARIDAQMTALTISPTTSASQPAPLFIARSESTEPPARPAPASWVRLPGNWRRAALEPSRMANPAMQRMVMPRPP